MNLFNIINKGTTTSVEYRNAITFIWLINLTFAVLIIHPYVSVIANYFSHSAIVDLFINKNFNLIGSEFYAYNPSVKSMLFKGLTLGIVIYYLISVALNGGFIGLLVRERGNKVASLLRSGFGNYKTLIIIGLISILGTIILLGIGVLLQMLSVKVFTLNTEPGFVYSLITIFSIIFVIFLLKEILIDYMRILYFRNLSEVSSIHLADAFKFIMKNIVKLFILATAMLLVLVIIGFLFYHLNKMIDSTALLAIFISFILHQIFIWIRIFWRSVFWSGEIILLEGPLGGKITEKDLWPEDEF